MRELALGEEKWAYDPGEACGGGAAAPLNPKPLSLCADPGVSGGLKSRAPPHAKAVYPKPVGPLLWRRCTRQPLDCDPEAVLLGSGLEARSVAAFLHENALEFIADDGMQSAADALGYLSDAGMARAGFRVWKLQVFGI